MRRFTCLATTIFVLSITAAGFAGSDIPDLKGTWVSKGSGSGHIRPSESPPPKLHAEKLGFHDTELLLVIDKQDGFRFSGYKKSSRKKETISGVIGFDNKTLYMVDDDGMSIAKLVSPDKIETIYFHVTKHHSIVARTIMTRKR